MGLLFDTPDLQITDDWIRARAAAVRVLEVRRAWVTRRRVGRGSLVLTAMLGSAVVLAVLGGAGLGNWLLEHWVWLLATPVILLAIAAVGLFDPIAIYLEKRHHELWLATESTSVMIYKANSVEVNKALRAIERAVERHRENTF